MAPASKAQRKATDKYIRETFDELKVRIPKGKKADLQAHAEGRGESLNAFINRAADNQIKQDRAVAAFTVQPSNDSGGEGGGV